MLYCFLFVLSGALFAATPCSPTGHFNGLFSDDQSYQACLSNPILSADGNSVIGLQHLTQQEQYHLLHESGSSTFVLFHANELYKGHSPSKHREALTIFQIVMQQEYIVADKRFTGVQTSALEERFNAFKRTTPEDLIRRKAERSMALNERIAARKINMQLTAKVVDPARKEKSTKQIIEEFDKKQGILLTTDKRRYYLLEAPIKELVEKIEQARLAGNDKLAEEIQHCLKHSNKYRLRRALTNVSPC